MKTAFLNIIFLTCICANVFAQEVKVEASVDKKEYLIGDHINLNLKTINSSNVKVEWPFLVDTINNFEIIKSSKIVPLNTEEIQGEIQQITLTNFDSGYHVIPPIPFSYTNAKNQKETVKTEPIMLRVNTFEIDTTKGITPIKTIEDVPLTLKEILPYIIGGVLSLAVLAAAILFILRRKKEEEPVYVPPPLPAHEQAFLDLKSLQEKNLIDQNEIKLYYSELTDILRNYIEGRFGVNAPEMTTPEIASEIKKIKEVKKGMLRNATELLSVADMVKFAKGRPKNQFSIDAFNNVMSFIENTIPVEETKEETENKA